MEKSNEKKLKSQFFQGPLTTTPEELSSKFEEFFKSNKLIFPQCFYFLEEHYLVELNQVFQGQKIYGVFSNISVIKKKEADIFKTSSTHKIKGLRLNPFCGPNNEIENSNRLPPPKPVIFSTDPAKDTMNMMLKVMETFTVMCRLPTEQNSLLSSNSSSFTRGESRPITLDQIDHLVTVCEIRINTLKDYFLINKDTASHRLVSENLQRFSDQERIITELVPSRFGPGCQKQEYIERKLVEINYNFVLSMEFQKDLLEANSALVDGKTRNSVVPRKSRKETIRVKLSDLIEGGMLARDAVISVQMSYPKADDKGMVLKVFNDNQNYYEGLEAKSYKYSKEKVKDESYQESYSEKSESIAQRSSKRDRTDNNKTQLNKRTASANQPSPKKKRTNS